MRNSNLFIARDLICNALVFDRKKLDYRTTGINLFLRKGLIKYRACKEPKNKNPQLLTEDSALVVSTGIEPVSNV